MTTPIITDPARLLPARCPAYSPWRHDGGEGWLENPWAPWEFRWSLARRSFDAVCSDPRRGDAWVNQPGLLAVSADRTNRTCAEKLVPISPRFRRRRCACGSFSMRGLSSPPVCASGLEHRRVGCAQKRPPFRLSDHLSGDDLVAAEGLAASLRRLVGLASKEEAH